MLAYSPLLLAHLLAAIIWIGGMLLMHFVVRPAAVATLPPPQRLPFLCSALGRFFDWVTGAIAVLLVSGLAMIVLAGGMSVVSPGVHVMLLLGLIMTGVFGWIRMRLYPPLRGAVEQQSWPVAAEMLDGIRVLVGVNLLLGLGALAALRLLPVH